MKPWSLPFSSPAQALAREQAKAKREKLELALLQQLRIADLMKGLFKQYEFNAPATKHRADFAYPEDHLLIEVDGGSWTQGKHTQGSGYAKDCEKGAYAAIKGYRVIHCTSNQIKSGAAVQWIALALGRDG